MPKLTRERLEQPISYIKGVEPEIEIFDLLIEQQQIEEMEAFATVDAEELANDVKEVLCTTVSGFGEYKNSEPEFVSKITYTHDSYPVPLRGYTDRIQVLVCFAKVWSKDWGGEIIGYTECEPTEVIASHPGRIYVLSNDAWWKVTHPNVAATEELNYLFFTLAKQEEGE